MSKKTAIIIPARWNSSRFPGKPLHILGGKPLVQHVWERASRAKNADLVVIATDDIRIAEAAFAFGAEVAMTSSEHPTGTDRIAEVARNLRGYSVIVNVQGDEPFIEPKIIDKLAEALQGQRSIEMATVACPFPEGVDTQDPNRVKVVVDHKGRALYFSRSCIPFDREPTESNSYLLHLGIYAYRRKFLLEFVQWTPSSLEEREKLEQLRALENGASIRVILAKKASPGIDTPEDAERAEKLLQE